jgi:NAD(P)-dependent dehydrogenase (short-subunit alcohol dehydrogenase family)
LQSGFQLFPRRRAEWTGLPKKGGAMLDGKVVVITGAAGGIGRWVAKTFAESRAKVVVADVKPLDAVSGELEDLGVDYIAVSTDISDETSAQSLIEAAVKRFGRIDVLHNNAAIVPHVSRQNSDWSRLGQLPPSLWDRVIQTNLGGTFRCSRFALPYMEAQRSGHIISTMGGSRRIGGAPYQISKDAIQSFTSALAEEERAFNICVVTMTPGGRIWVESNPDEETRAQFPGVEAVGNRFVLAAQAGMELSGELIDVEDGRLVARSQNRRL